MKDTFGKTVLVRMPYRVRMRANQHKQKAERMNGRTSLNSFAVHLIELGLTVQDQAWQPRKSEWR
jgi:hypothetical protein